MRYAFKGSLFIYCKSRLGRRYLQINEITRCLTECNSEQVSPYECPLETPETTTPNHNLEVQHNPSTPSTFIIPHHHHYLKAGCSCSSTPSCIFPPFSQRRPKQSINPNTQLQKHDIFVTFSAPAASPFPFPFPFPFFSSVASTSTPALIPSSPSSAGLKSSKAG